MAFNIICARAKGGKSKYIYEEIRRLASEGEQVILIVPEQYTHEAERKALSVVDSINADSVEVTSFAHLASGTGKLLGIAPHASLGAVGKALIVSEILKKSNPLFFKNTSFGGGFSDVVTSSIGEFKKYLILPETLTEAAKKADDEVLGMKLCDLAEIYAKYEQTICNRYDDTDDALTVFAKRLSESAVYSEKHIFLDEFSTFVPQEVALIRELEKQAKSLTVTLCCDTGDKNPTLFMPTADTLRLLRDSIPARANIKKIEGAHFNSPDLAYLEENLYRFPPKKFDGKCGDVKVFSAANPGAETEVAAENIISLVRDGGYKFGEIGVICSDIGAYERHIERIFAQYKIPFFIDEKKEVTGHHIIRFILSALDVYTDDYSFESIFGFLKAAYGGANPRRLCVLRDFISRAKLRRKTWLDDEKWHTLTDAYFENDERAKDDVNSIREKYILPLAKMHERIKGRHSAEDDARALYELIETLELPKTIEKYIERFNAEGDIRLSKEYEQIWDVVTGALDELVNTCGSVTVSPADFAQMLHTAFAQNKIGYIPSTVDRVLVGNTERTRADGIRALFVLGVNEGVFPVAPKNDGVLSDRDKVKLEGCGVKFSTTSEIAAYYSQFSVYTALCLPSDKLFISYAKAGNDFKTLRKSYAVTRVLNILKISEVSDREFWSDERKKLSSATVCREALCENVAAYCRFEDADPIWRSVYDYFEKNTDFVPKMTEFLHSDNIAHRLNDEHLKKLVGMMEHTSISKIQRYAACRYAYFMDYILGIRPPKDETVDRLDIGNITHYILEHVLRDISESGTPFADADDNEAKIKIENMLNDFISQTAKCTDNFTEREKYIIKRLKNSVFLCYKAIKKHIADSLFEPLGYEMEFADGTDLGCIKIETEDGKTVNLTGKIDRADAYKTKDGTFIRVVDYKTGAKSFRLDDIFYGLDVQLVVYLNALVESDPAYRHGGALYFLIDDPMIKAKGRISDESISEKLDSALKLRGMIVSDEAASEGYDKKTAAIRNKYEPEKFALMDKYLKKLLGKICTDMSHGDISINPCKKGGTSPCDYCKYGSVCRFDETDGNNSYNYLEPIAKADEIWDKMEESLNVDDKPTDSD